jgi:hypothetical protein
MLKPSYAAIKQFQSQKFSIKTLQSLKTLLQQLDLSMTLQIESPTIWKLSWDLLEDTVAGTIEVRIQPCLLSGTDIFKARHFTTLRLEEPVGIALSALEVKLLDIIKDSIETIR